MKRIALIGLIILGTLSGCATVDPESAEKGHGLMPGFPYFPYEKEGPFVIAPAQTIASIPFQVGFLTGSVLCLPLSLAKDVRSGGTMTDRDAPSLKCGKWLGIGIGWPAYAGSGLPFYLLKNMFWTGPRALINHLRAPSQASFSSPSDADYADR